MVDCLFGEDNLLRFRDDLKSAFLPHINPEKIDERSARLVEITRNRFENSKKRHKKVRLIWAVAGGVLSLALSRYGFGILSSSLTIISIMIALEIPLRNSVIEIAAYHEVNENMQEGELIFRKAWNSVMYSTISLAVLLLPALLLKLGFEKHYRALVSKTARWIGSRLGH